MGLEVGYNQLDKGEKIYFKYPIKNYYKLISKLTNQSLPSETCLVKLYSLTSAYTNKYAIKLRNFFFYTNTPQSNDSNNIKRFNFEISKKSKLISMINFDISPIIKLTINGLFSMKYGKYEANNDQYINTSNNNYDFSSVFPSMIPHHRFSTSIYRSFPLPPLNSINRTKISYNKIFNFESAIKLCNEVRSYFKIPFFKLFTANITNEFVMKKIFIFNNKMNNVFNHATSGFSCISKLLAMNIPQRQNTIDPGENFYIKNLTSVRMENLPLLSKFGDRVVPYYSIETFMTPLKSLALKAICSLGFSIKLQNNFYLDLSLYTCASNNINVKHKFINRFRINIGN